MLRRTLWTCVCVISIASLGVPQMARAQDATTTTDADEAARRQFRIGQAFYDNGDFAQAADAFDEAYARSHRPELLYNLYLARRDAGQRTAAIAALRGYLDQVPDTERGASLRARLQIMEQEEAAAAASTPAPETTPTPEPVTPPPPASSSVDPAPWIVLGSGAAVAIVGAALMGVGFADASRVNDPPMGTPWSDLSSNASDANTLWGVGLTLAIVGVVAVGAGLVWGVVGGSHGDQASARLHLGPTGLSLEGTF